MCRTLRHLKKKSIRLIVIIIILAIMFSQWARHCYMWSSSVHLILSSQSVSNYPHSTDFTQIFTEKLLVSRYSGT